MVAPRKIYDFCDPENGSAAPPPAQRRHPQIEGKIEDKIACRVDGGDDYRSDFFIDGWDAYDRWLDDVRDRMDDGHDKPA